MRVLVTGAFGNLGQSTLEILLASDHEITTLDILTLATRKSAKELSAKGNFIPIWGSVLDKTLVSETIKNQDCIIHFAGVTPPVTENNPEIGYKINVVGTKNIIEAALKQKKHPKIIFPSTISIYGPLPPSAEPRTSEHAINPSDEYTRNKAEAEKLIQESDLPWTILRITAVPSTSILQNQISLLYNIPLDQKIEFAHTKDIGKAISNTLTESTTSKILMLGGGEESQLTNREFVGSILDTLGIKMLPEEVFKKPKSNDDWYYTSWMDTEESQRLLDYQSRTFKDYLDEVRKKTKPLRFIITIFRPIVRSILIRRSPYYKQNIKQS
ncbi:MAG: NAD(P)-dependent oxidoreductase [Candidatus Heimdallarchaeota archaeon]|nr:NAD(P)-dependent oxidoreductase [Candidatus Heimdallarchaeota archaeon]